MIVASGRNIMVERSMISHEISVKGTDIEKQAREGKLALFEGYQTGDKETMFKEVVDMMTPLPIKFNRVE